MLGYLLFCVILMGLGYGAFWLWRRPVERDIAEGAKVEFQRLQKMDPDLLASLDEDSFSTIYHRTEFPRFPTYVLVALGIFLVGTPIALGLLSGIAYFALDWGIIPQPGDAATDLYLGANETSVVRKVNPETLSYILQGWSGFYYFFGLLAFWGGTVYMVMSRYHRNAPGTLREEILRAR